jgi:hypothetical protein
MEEIYNEVRIFGFKEKSTFELTVLTEHDLEWEGVRAYLL